MGRTSFAVEGMAPGLSKLAASLIPNQGAEAAAYDSSMERQTKIGSMLAKMQHAQAAARKDDAETDIMTRRPGMYEEQAAMASGVDTPMVKAIRKMVAGDPSTQMGPETPDGQFGKTGLPIDSATQSKVMQSLQRLAPMLYNKGDIAPDNLAKASGLYADQDREASALSGGLTQPQIENFRQYKMAEGGKDRYSMGGEGRLDQFGGGVDTSAATTQANIKKRQADTVQSYASANSSNASAAKTRRDAETSGLAYDPTNQVVVDKRTSTSRPVVGADGRPLQQAGGPAVEPSGASVLGVPMPAVTTWQNQTNPKDANKVKLAEVNRGTKEIEKDSDAARLSTQAAQDAKRFLELNSKNKTGGVSDKFGAGQWVNSFSPNYAEMHGITARLAPANRVPGSGATSDFDAKQFERATVGVDKHAETNQSIGNAIIARSELSADYADFRQTYLEQNGTLSGSERYWKQYTNANPIFDPSKPGTFELNSGRRGWRDHFSGGQSAAPPAEQAQPAQPTQAAPAPASRNIRVNF